MTAPFQHRAPSFPPEMAGPFAILGPMKTKTVRFNGTNFQDLFGIVTLKPGDNEVPLDKFNAVRHLRLGEMTEPYLDWARSRGFIHFEDDPTDAAVPAHEVKPYAAHNPDDMSDPRNVKVPPTFDEDAKTLELDGEILEVAAGPIGVDDSSPALEDDAALGEAPSAPEVATSGEVPAKRKPGRPRKNPAPQG